MNRIIGNACLQIMAVAVGLSLSACQTVFPSQNDRAERSTPEPAIDSLKLGATLPATGPFAKAGDPVLETLPLLTSTVNACGGVNNASVELIVENNQPDAEAAASAMTRLNAAGVGGVVGTFSNDAAALAAIRVAAKNKIPLISPSSTSAVFTEQARTGDFRGFWARTIPADTQQAIALAQLAHDKGLKTVSTLMVNDADGIRFEKSFVSAFEKLGGTVLNKSRPARYKPDDFIFDADAADVFNPEGKVPDAVVNALSGEAGSAILQSAQAQNLMSGVQILLTDKARQPGFIESVGQSINGKSLLLGAIGVSPGGLSSSDQEAAIASFRELWQEKQKTPILENAPQVWDAAALILLAAQAAQSNQGGAIKSKLRAVANPPGEEVSDICEALQRVRNGGEVNYRGISGKVDLDVNGDIGGRYDTWTIDMQGKIRVTGQIDLDS